MLSPPSTGKTKVRTIRSLPLSDGRPFVPCDARNRGQHRPCEAANHFCNKIGTCRTCRRQIPVSRTTTRLSLSLTPDFELKSDIAASRETTMLPR